MFNINIEDCQYLELSGLKVNNAFLDLSKFIKLKEVKLLNVENNILLPSYLQKMFIYQNEQVYSLLNKQISCNYIKIQSFDMSDIILEGCQTINLEDCSSNRLTLKNLQFTQQQSKDLSAEIIGLKFRYCQFKILDCMDSNWLYFDDSMFMNNTIAQLILPQVIQQILWKRSKIEELIFPNYDSIKSIDISNCPQYIYCLLDEPINRDIIDLSKYKNLKDPKLDFTNKDDVYQ